MFEMGRFSPALAAFPAAVIKSLESSNKGRNEGMKKGFGFWLTTVPGCRVYHTKKAASHMCQNRQQFMQHAQLPFSTYIIQEWHTQWVGLPTSMKTRYPHPPQSCLKAYLPDESRFCQVDNSITLPYIQKEITNAMYLPEHQITERLVHSLDCHCWDSFLRCMLPGA